MSKDVNRQINDLLLAVEDDEVCFEDKHGDEWELGKYAKTDGQMVFWLAQLGQSTEYHDILGVNKRLMELLQ